MSHWIVEYLEPGGESRSWTYASPSASRRMNRDEAQSLARRLSRRKVSEGESVYVIKYKRIDDREGLDAFEAVGQITYIDGRLDWREGDTEEDVNNEKSD